MKLTIGYLYGDCMNIYGDTGNIITLTQRCKWRDIDVEVKNISLNDKITPGSIDLYFFGGGQDQAQVEVAKDLKISGKGEVIKKDVDNWVPLLSVCGGYQLLGAYYQPHEGEKLIGTNLFDLYTKASLGRMIGNIIVESQFGKLVGFENHSGKTYLGKDATALGKVISGSGNNGEDKSEGCLYRNAIGCYMHGSLLPKNPDLADWLIKKALEAKYKTVVDLTPLRDDFEHSAHQSAIQKFG